jgi:catechol 2,3-dioxygenase
VYSPLAFRCKGATDHGGGESIYLSNLDANGVELYCDKPKEKWPRSKDGQLEMYTRRIDLRKLLGEAEEKIEMTSGPEDL